MILFGVITRKPGMVRRLGGIRNVSASGVDGLSLIKCEDTSQFASYRSEQSLLHTGGYRGVTMQQFPRKKEKKKKAFFSLRKSANVD